MNKKFLSAILFGALMVTSTGTFVSCKDYDDDIENLQGQISANSSAIAELKALLGDGNYVTSISVSGNSLVVNTKNGSTNVALPECEDEVGSICTVSEEGELLIDGKATGIKVAEGTTEDGEFLPAVKIVDGEWAVLQEDGTYKSTGVAVSSVAVTGDKQNGYVLTIKDAEGTATVIELPTAASLITSIEVAPNVKHDDAYNDDYAVLRVTSATFSKPDTWAGKRELPSNLSRVYAVSALNVRVNPVNAPVEDVEFYLTNTKNHTLSNLKLSASATQDSNNGAITIGGINGRAAVTGNGLWTLGQSQFVLAETAAKAFDKDLADNGTIDEDGTYLDADKNEIAEPEYLASAYSVNANMVARSNYNVAVTRKAAAALTGVRVYDNSSSWITASLVATDDTPSAENITVNVGQTYKINEAAGESGLMWDMYFSAASETAIETFGIEFDHLNRTFKVTKRPDVTTPDNGFTMYVYTLDIKGNKMVAAYKVSLSSAVSGSATYAAVTHDLSSIATSTGADDYFTLPISTMKDALGNNWTTWANSVDLTKTSVVAYAYSNLTGKVAEIGRYTTDTDGDAVAPTSQAETGLGYYLLNANGGMTENVNSLNNIRINVSRATGEKPTYTVDTQYYIKVTFLDKANATTGYAGGQYINHIVVPVTFTAPTVADQFTLKSGYVVDGVINAYYYNYEKASKEVVLKHYFDKWDAEATLALDTDAALGTWYGDSKAKNSAQLAVITAATDDTETDKVDESKDAMNGTIKLNTTYDMGDATGREFGYGKGLIVEASNETYDGWAYKTAAQKAYSFTIKLMSPIFEGVIAPASGSTINVTANAEEGFAITKSMITLSDYNKNTYNVVPDVAGKKPTNASDNTTDAWEAEQIANVWVTKDGNNTYIKKFDMRAHEVEDGEVTVEGAIMLYADPLPNTQATSMNVNVKDCWGYVKTQEVSVTIVKK